MNKKALYFENFSLRILIIWSINNSGFKKILSKSKVYYFDANYFSQKILIPLLKNINISIERVNFRLIDIKDDNDELVRLRISRLDLIEIQDKILNTESFKSIIHDTWHQDFVFQYIEKGISDGGIILEKSMSRIIFLILVVDWHSKKNILADAEFIINNRGWFEIYFDYAEKLNINLFAINNSLLSISRIKLYNFIGYFPELFLILKTLRERKSIDFSSSIPTNNHLTYVQGRGDLSFNNDGYHSDFFWSINSDFPNNKIMCKYVTNDEKEYLSEFGVFSVPEDNIIVNFSKRNYVRPKLNSPSQYKNETLELQTLITQYDFSRAYWSSFFKKYSVKIFFTWYKHSNTHIALSDAIKDNGGISVLWQMAYDGYPIISCKSYFDVAFCNSKQSYEIDKKLGSKVKYTIITGYPKDYAANLLKNEAKKIRNQLLNCGAKKIIFSIDENSNDDSRWHTGHELQQENYSYLLQKVLDIPWLGVVFKPKVAYSIRQRLGPVADLLKKAEATGRCYVYEKTTRLHNTAPPILAGLSADVCIHGHLAGGTAALECALEGKPTLMVDREGTPFSKLYDLPIGKVIFKDWESAIEAVMEHLNSKDGTPGFGDWSSIIDDLDPFRDGKAAFRIGSFMNSLVQGFDQGLDRDAIMLSATEEYKKNWGDDKVICD